MRQPKVLVVDDHRSVLDLMRLLLEGEGYSVIEATGGTEALKVIKRQSPDLLVLDLMMPDIEGERVIKDLWNDQKSTKLPIIVVSAKTEALDGMKELISSENVFAKPFEPTHFLDRVRELLG